MFNWRKSHPVADMVEEYTRKAEACVGLFKMAFEMYLQKGLSADFDALVQKVDMAETECDEIRRRVEQAMYEQALIPESRADIMNLIEKMDKLPNRAERILFRIQVEMLRVPQSLAGKFRQLVRINCEAFDDLAQAMRLLFTNTDEIRPIVKKVGMKESAADDLELEVIRLIFRDDGIPGDQRILLRDLVTQLCKISDLAENCCEALNITVVKRLV